MYQTRPRPESFSGHGETPASQLPIAWIAPLLVLFTLGGLIFGLVFLRNVNTIIARSTPVELTIPGEVAAAQAAPPAQEAELPGILPEEIERGISGLPAAIATMIPVAPAAEAPPPAAEVEQLEPLPTWNGTDRVNILLLGIDRRAEEPADTTRTDTMMVISVDPVAHSAVMLSFPRDLWVNIPGYGEQRINVAHSIGGPNLAARTIEANFGMPMHYWARIDFDGFRKIVNTLDGVLIDVERPIKDDEYPTADYGYQRVYIPPGPQVMDGETALIYARSRHSESDFGRAHRQQRVLLAMRERALQFNILPKLPQLYTEANEAVFSNMELADMLSLAGLANELDSGRVSSVVFDTNYATPFEGEAGQQLLQPNYGAIAYVIARVNAGLEPEPARLEILNGSEVEGLAARTGDLLASWGFEIVSIAPADRTDYQGTQIVVLGNRLQSAERLAEALGLPPDAVRSEPTPGSYADLRIIVGNGFELPTQ